MIFPPSIPKGNGFCEIQTSWKLRLAGKYPSQYVFYTKENLNSTEPKPQWLGYYTAEVFHHYFNVELHLALSLTQSIRHFCPKSWKRTTSGHHMPEIGVTQVI